MELISNAPTLLNPMHGSATMLPNYSSITSLGPALVALTDADQAEVFRFLSPRPVHTAILSGLIYDHGLESRTARGVFYGVRSPSGELEGVALIGQTTTFEVSSKRALHIIARKAQRSGAGIGFIIGEEKEFELFWRYFSGNNQPLPKRMRRELLYELTRGAQFDEDPIDLRAATIADLEQIVTAHAAMAVEQWGSNPFKNDWHGFRERCARRIKQGRVWVVTEEGQLIFKADVAARTPVTAYLEGIYVKPSLRGRGVGSRSLAQLNHVLLSQHKNICLLVDEYNYAACRLYNRCGYQLRSFYSSISLFGA